MSHRSRRKDKYEEDIEDEEEEEMEEFGEDDDGFVVEDDDDDDEAYGAPSRTKKKPKNASMFIDDAAIDSEGEEDDYEEEEEEGFIDYDNEVPESSGRISSHYARHPMAEEEESAEAIADRFNKKYIERNDAYRPDSNISQTGMLPSNSDPNLWMIKCKAGKERDILMALMKRSIQRKRTGQEYQIESAFFRESLKGYLYVESYKATFVQKAIEKIPDLYGGKVTLVPRKEMIDVLEIKNKSSDLTLGGWARIKRGKYTGDLCQIIGISDSQDMVRAKLIPRLDLNQEAPAAGAKRGIPARPPQRLFSRKEVELAQTTRGTVIKSRGYYLYNGETFKDGFLEKDFKTTALITTNVNATYDEITNFANAFEDKGAKAKVLATLTAPLIAAQRRSAQLHIGDYVEIIEGSMSAVSGTLEKIEGDTATISTQIGTLQKFSVPLDKIRKHYREGDHVKVIAGKYKGETGSVVKVLDNVATIISDANTAQLQVFTKDLGEAILSNASNSTHAKYSIHDIVQLDHHTMGIIIKSNNDNYKVLDQNGLVRSVSSQLITPLKGIRRTVAIDSRNNPINVGDQVKTTHVAGRQGTILHINKNMAFIKAKEGTDNAGVFVEKCHFLLTLTPRSLKGPTPSNQTPDGFVIPTNPAPGRGGGMAGNARGAGRGRGSLRRRDPLVDKTVTIRSGPYKGYLGIVKDVIENLARIELHTSFRIVSVNRESISAPGDDTPAENSYGNVNNYSNNHRGGSWGGHPTKTPNYPRPGGNRNHHTSSDQGWPKDKQTTSRVSWGTGQTPNHRNASWNNGLQRNNSRDFQPLSKNWSENSSPWQSREDDNWGTNRATGSGNWQDSASRSDGNWGDNNSEPATPSGGGGGWDEPLGSGTKSTRNAPASDSWGSGGNSQNDSAGDPWNTSNNSRGSSTRDSWGESSNDQVTAGGDSWGSSKSRFDTSTGSSRNISKNSHNASTGSSWRSKNNMQSLSSGDPWGSGAGSRNTSGGDSWGASNSGQKTSTGSGSWGDDNSNQGTPAADSWGSDSQSTQVADSWESGKSARNSTTEDSWETPNPKSKPTTATKGGWDSPMTNDNNGREKSSGDWGSADWENPNESASTIQLPATPAGDSAWDTPTSHSKDSWVEPPRAWESVKPNSSWDQDTTIDKWATPKADEWNASDYMQESSGAWGQESAPTPGGYNPATPGASIPFTPGGGSAATPGGLATLAPLIPHNLSPEPEHHLAPLSPPRQSASVLDTDWFAKELIVAVGSDRQSGRRHRYAGKEGQITSVDKTARTCVLAPVDLHEPSFKDPIVVPWSYLSPTPPKRRQRLMVLAGDHSGEFGQTVGQDRRQHYCRLDKDNSLVTLSVDILCSAYTPPE